MHRTNNDIIVILRFNARLGENIISNIKNNNSVILIKKYPNRRLYNFSTSKYITLYKLKEIICNGSEVLITEHSTGKNITQATLLQLLFEININEGEKFPNILLQKIIFYTNKDSSKNFLAIIDSAIKEFENSTSLNSKSLLKRPSLISLELQILEIKKQIQEMK